MEELEAGIRKEYDKNYLWTGDINEALYEVRWKLPQLSGGMPVDASASHIGH